MRSVNKRLFNNLQPARVTQRSHSGKYMLKLTIENLLKSSKETIYLLNQRVKGRHRVASW